MLINIVGFIVATLILVGIHEFGHFYVARLCGVKVLRFSIGIGKTIWSIKDKLGTEFAISLLPIGGYVLMLGERGSDTPILEEDKPYSFESKPLWQRIAIIIAGPAINFIFAMFLYSLIFGIGVEKVAPVVGPVVSHSQAYHAGFRGGEKIIAVNNESIFSWEDILAKLYAAEIGHAIDFEVMQQGQIQHKYIASEQIQLEGDILEQIGLVPWEPVDLTIDNFVPGLPAIDSGLKKGDKILEVNQLPVQTRSQVIKMIKANAGKLVALKVIRAEREQLIVKLRVSEQGMVGIKFIKIDLPDKYILTQKYSWTEAIWRGYLKTVEYSDLTLKMLGRMLQGIVSVKQLGGPISVAEQAGASMQYGFIYFINFLGLLSVSLAVLNMLPIPILDGGQICINCIEALLKCFGKILSERTYDLVFKFGLVIVILVSSLALYNDLARLI